MKLTNCLYLYLFPKNKIIPKDLKENLENTTNHITNKQKENTLRLAKKVYPLNENFKNKSLNINEEIANYYKEKIPKICGLPNKTKVICGTNFKLKEELTNFETELKASKVPLKKTEIMAFLYFKETKSNLIIFIIKKCNPDQTQHFLLSLNSKTFEYKQLKFNLLAAGEIYTKTNFIIESQTYPTFTLSPKTGSFYTGESKIENLNENVKILANQYNLNYLDYKG